MDTLKDLISDLKEEQKFSFVKGNSYMNKDEIRKICEKRFIELGAEEIELQPSGRCWTLNGDFEAGGDCAAQWKEGTPVGGRVWDGAWAKMRKGSVRLQPGTPSFSFIW